jgi:ADP-ribosylglycohydrolase
MESGGVKRAWEIDRQLRLSAVPVDRRKEGSHWYTSETVFPTGDDLIALFWEARVPGSGAPEIPYVEMVESMANRGYDMRSAEALLPEGMRLARQGDRPGLRVLTARLLAAVHAAPPDPRSPYWSFEHPSDWQSVLGALDPLALTTGREPPSFQDLEARIYAGWLGQLAGGAFGTAIEGYHSDQIAAVYGPIDCFITTPETINDDVTYELVFLDVFERLGRALTSVDIGLEWVRQIPFGWSAEWVALHNLADGILPPKSGRFRNPYSDWIGAQMRGMICGLLAPGFPLEAARLAHLDGVVSHSANGVYGEMYAAVLTSLAFVRFEPRQLILEALRFIPRRSEYAHITGEVLETLRTESDPAQAWRKLDRRFEQYNWIHAYPNLAADLLALWHSEGDMTAAFRLLAHAGLDVDCNAGLVGTVLGVMSGVPERWGAPLQDTLETYLPGKEKLSIRALARRTASLAHDNLAALRSETG